MAFPVEGVYHEQWAVEQVAKKIIIHCEVDG